MKVSIQGNKGSYSHIAASKFFNENLNLLERDNFTDVFDDLKNNKAEYIIVPIENSTHGSVYQNYDNLSKYNFEIIGEIYLKINFHLIVNPESDFDDIKEIYTHPVGMNQIRTFLRNNNHIKAFKYKDTAGSVKMIKKEERKNAAAAASKFAAEIYEMKVIKENIHENKKNYTRFFVLSKNKNNKKNNENNSFKTTIQFQLGEEAGSLYKSLRCFADRDIALSKIESRPILNTDWEYRFYLDVEEQVNSNKFKNSMNELVDYAKDLKVLGSYISGKYIET